jgi:hypothetical protein
MSAQSIVQSSVVILVVVLVFLLNRRAQRGDGAGE